MNQNEKLCMSFKEEFDIDGMVCCYADEAVQQLARIITYGTERALYEIWQEACSDLTWEEFLFFLSSSEELLERARQVMIQAQCDFGAAQYNFENPEPGKSYGQTCIVRLYEQTQMEAMVIPFLFKAELVHHQQMRRQQGVTYTLRQYMQDLQTDEELIRALRRGFEDSVYRLDFRAAWLQAGVDLPRDLFEK